MTSTSLPADRAWTRRATVYVVRHYLLMYLGYYGLVSTLVVVLSAASFDAGAVAVLVAVFALTNKVTGIALAPWLDRVPAATSALLGCLVAAGGFVGLRFAAGLTATVVALAVAGTGISVNALATKRLAADASDRITDRGRLFSLISIGVNVAAAVAAPVALFLVDRGRQAEVLLAVAALYCVAGVVAFLGRRSVDTGRPAARGTSPRAFADALRDPAMRRFLLVNAFYWFLYGQLFNVLAVHVSVTLGTSAGLGWLYTLNALLVVFGQLAVTRGAHALARGRMQTVIVLSYGLFAVAFLAPQLVPGYVGAVVFVVLFTVAEMMFVPSADVVIVGLIDQHRRAVGYSLFAISTAIGEAAGAGLGVAAYQWLAGAGQGGAFWFGAAVLACGFAVATRWLARAAPVR